MKSNKKSLVIAVVCVLLVVGAIIIFAKYNRPQKPDIQTNVTQAEYDSLLAMRFDQYETMLVTEFRKSVWKNLDADVYADLLSRVQDDMGMYDKRRTDADAFFIYQVLIPLTGRDYAQPQYYNDFIVAPNDGSAANPAVMDYEIMLTLIDPAVVYVQEYIAYTVGISEHLQIFMQSKTPLELQDEAAMHAALDTYTQELSKKFDADTLQLEVIYSYQPLQTLNEESLQVIKTELDISLAPYSPFGVTYVVDVITGEVKLYWQDIEICGIYDETKGTWVSNYSMHMTYDKNMAVLLAVYDNEALIGLRKATAEEITALNTIKEQQTTTRPMDENRENEPGTKEDYTSLLQLKSKDYEKQSVADFNRALLDWGNVNFERYERINIDTSWNDIHVLLSDEDKNFVMTTVRFSHAENVVLMRSEFAGQPKADPDFGRSLTKDESYGTHTTWASLDYQIMYHITDERMLTVKERDAAIVKVIQDIQQYWDSRDIDTLALLTKEDIVKEILTIAAKYSNDGIAILPDANHIYFECQIETNA